jgi:hypothetical protein
MRCFNMFASAKSGWEVPRVAKSFTREDHEPVLFPSRKERWKVAEGEGAKQNNDSTLNTPLSIHKGMMFE